LSPLAFLTAADLHGRTSLKAPADVFTVPPTLVGKEVRWKNYAEAFTFTPFPALPRQRHDRRDGRAPRSPWRWLRCRATPSPGCAGGPQLVFAGFLATADDPQECSWCHVHQ